MEKKKNTLIPNVLGLQESQIMDSIMFRLSKFTKQLLVVGYHIFCEINAAHITDPHLFEQNSNINVITI